MEEEVTLKEILKRNDGCFLYAFDQDEDALENELEDERFTLIHENFSELENMLKLYRVEVADGLLADLGVSSHQFDQESRGFSIRFDGPLDMRMERGVQKTAADILLEYSWEELAEVFRNYSDIKGAGRVARKIKEAVELNGLKTTGELVDVLKKMTPVKKENKFLAQVFQALRIEVNDEMKALKALLEQAVKVLRPGGSWL